MIPLVRRRIFGRRDFAQERSSENDPLFPAAQDEIPFVPAAFLATDPP